jgi:hypothetical protein
MEVSDDDDMPALSPRNNKRQRPVRPEVQDLLRLARVIWSRDPDKVRTTQTEDRDFRELFGCGVLVALSLWGLLLTTDLLPEDGTLEHLLWTLMFMKVYAKQKTMCSLCGGIDPQTLKKWTELFIEAISYLEPMVVSESQHNLKSFLRLSSDLHTFPSFCSCCRSYGRIGSRRMGTMTVSRLLMAQTFGLQRMVETFIATSTRSLDFVTKWDSALPLVTLFGSMVHMSVACGLILASSETLF